MIKQLTFQLIEKVIRAFNDHQQIMVRKTDGKLLGPGHIMIMYGEVAFRMQIKDTNESHFVRIEDIDKIIVK